MQSRRIYLDAPADWKQLQAFTAAILSDCGFHTSVERTIPLVRGNAEIDVYAEKKAAVESKVICECKHWASPVPQTVVHSFRTIVNDSGANHGFIISKAGFQKGAYEAIEKTNVSLLNWNEFQEKFTMEWLSQIIERNYKASREIFTLSHKLFDDIHNGTLQLNEEEMNTIYEKRESDFHFYAFKEHYIELDTVEISRGLVDMCINGFERQSGLSFTCYREYFDAIFLTSNQIIAEWKTMLTH